MSTPVSIARPALSSWYAAELQEARSRYLREWGLLKRARFNAAKRFERKHQASMLAFAMAGVAGIALPFFTQLFGDAMSQHTRHVFELYGYLAGVLAFGLGLVEQARGYESLSRRFDECGRRVNATLRKLRNNPALDEYVLEQLAGEYQQALDLCDVNHDDIDREIALAQDDREMLRGAGDPTSLKLRAAADRRLAALRWQESFEIYWLYWVALLAPIMLAVAAWALLAKAPDLG